MTKTTEVTALELAKKASALARESRDKAVQAANAMTDLRQALQREGRSTETDMQAMCNTFDAVASGVQAVSLELAAAWMDLWTAANGVTWEDA